MIYPEVTLEEWLREHPVLEIRKAKCKSCGTILVTNIPFIEKDWLGIQSKDCTCGKSKAISVSVVRKSSAAFGLVDSRVSAFKDTQRNKNELKNNKN